MIKFSINVKDKRFDISINDIAYEPYDFQITIFGSNMVFLRSEVESGELSDDLNNEVKINYNSFLQKNLHDFREALDKAKKYLIFT